jgi:hypothetical protein
MPWPNIGSESMLTANLCQLKQINKCSKDLYCSRPSAVTLSGSHSMPRACRNFWVVDDLENFRLGRKVSFVLLTKNKQNSRQGAHR